MSEIVKDVLAITKSRGGAADRIVTRYDHDRDGRVMEVVLFFPGKSGYDDPRDGTPVGRSVGGDMKGLRALAQEMRANSERWFPRLHDGSVDLVTFYTMGLMGEAGEVANEVKKMLRPHDGTGERRVDLPVELADVFTYLLLLADECDVDLVAEYKAKVAVNEQRWGRGIGPWEAT